MIFVVVMTALMWMWKLCRSVLTGHWLGVSNVELGKFMFFICMCRISNLVFFLNFLMRHPDWLINGNVFYSLFFESSHNWCMEDMCVNKKTIFISVVWLLENTYPVYKYFCKSGIYWNYWLTTWFETMILKLTISGIWTTNYV